MSSKEMKDLYYRSVVYQFTFFFYSVIMMNYLQEPMLKNASLVIALINMWVITKTLNEYRRKKQLYIDAQE